MRILHVGKYYPPFYGGIESFMGDLLPALARRGIEVGAVVHDHSGGALPVAERTEGGGAVRLWRARCYGKLLYAPLSPAFPALLAAAIRDFRPDLLHLHLPNVSAFAALLLPAARRLPWVVHWHADVVASAFDRRLRFAYPFYRPFEQALLARAAAVIATSPPYLAGSPALARWHDKTRVIPLGLDPARLPTPSPAARAWADSLWGDRCRLLAIGRLTYYKGHDTLLRATALLPAVHTVIVGEGERRPQLERLIAASGIGDRVTLAGRQPPERLAALLAGCDIFVLPSIERTEAFGVVLMEAMQQGKPVVASEIPGSGVGWVVEAERTGLLAPAGEPRSLAERIARLGADRRLRAQLAAAAAERFQQRFHIDAVAARTAELYRELLPAP